MVRDNDGEEGGNSHANAVKEDEQDNDRQETGTNGTFVVQQKQQQQQSPPSSQRSSSSSSLSRIPPRFVRLNPRFDRDETLRRLRFCEGTVPKEVPWSSSSSSSSSFADFVSLPGDFPLRDSACFAEGRVYGMDVCSGAAVTALDLEDVDDDVRDRTIRVLDLCCAPGLKTCAIHDALTSRKDSSSPSPSLSPALVVGVDVSERRAALCKNLLRKYLVDADTSGRRARGDDARRSDNDEREVNVRLYLEDGTTFGGAGKDHDDGPRSDALVFDLRTALEEEDADKSKRRPPTAASGLVKRKRMNKSARARERKRLRAVADADRDRDESSFLFDRVLVDAECGTDGATRHQRIRDNDGDDRERRQRWVDRSRLRDLQRRLIVSGFRSLKRTGGAIMVYSTCSADRRQNEDVVEWLLSHDEFRDEAFLIPCAFPGAPSAAEGSLRGTVRFSPNDDGKGGDFAGGGFFLAKLGRKAKTKEARGT